MYTCPSVALDWLALARGARDCGGGLVLFGFGDEDTEVVELVFGAAEVEVLVGFESGGGAVFSCLNACGDFGEVDIAFGGGDAGVSHVFLDDFDFHAVDGAVGGEEVAHGMRRDKIQGAHVCFDFRDGAGDDLIKLVLGESSGGFFNGGEEGGIERADVFAAAEFGESVCVVSAEVGGADVAGFGEVAEVDDAPLSVLFGTCDNDLEAGFVERDIAHVDEPYFGSSCSDES